MFLFIYSDKNKREWAEIEPTNIRKYFPLYRYSVLLMEPIKVQGWKNKIIFECEAENILEADKLFKKAIGKDPDKMPNISIQLFNLIFDEDVDNLEIVDPVKIDSWNIEHIWN